MQPNPSDDAVNELRSEAEQADGRHVSDDDTRSSVTASGRRGALDVLGENRFLVAITFGTALVVGVFLSLVTNSWWLLVAAMLVHGLATFVVAGTVIRLTGEQDKPDPVTVARMQEEGIRDPERSLNRLER